MPNQRKWTPPDGSIDRSFARARPFGSLSVSRAKRKIHNRDRFISFRNEDPPVKPPPDAGPGVFRQLSRPKPVIFPCTSGRLPDRRRNELRKTCR
jgi:hypothetical protein